MVSASSTLEDVYRTRESLDATLSQTRKLDPDDLAQCLSSYRLASVSFLEGITEFVGCLVSATAERCGAGPAMKASFQELQATYAQLVDATGQAKAALPTIWRLRAGEAACLATYGGRPGGRADPRASPGDERD